MEKILLNGFILVIPPLVWNIIFYGKLIQKEFNDDENVPKILLYSEHLFRICVFGSPLLFSMCTQCDNISQSFLIYKAGIVIYFLSWIPLLYFPNVRWSNSFIGIMAPYFTPIIWLIGIAYIINWDWYFLISGIFIIIHIIHGMISFNYINTGKYN